MGRDGRRGEGAVVRPRATSSWWSWARRPIPGREHLEGPANQRCPFLVQLNGANLAAELVTYPDVSVADRRLDTVPPCGRPPSSNNVTADKRAARRRTVSMRSSTNAATSADEARRRLRWRADRRVPCWVRKVSGSKRSLGPGVTASSTRGSARAARARETPCQVDAVAGLGVGVDHGSERVAPPHRRVGVGVEDCDGFGGGAGVERPSEQLGRWSAVVGGGVEQRLECSSGLAFPEASGFDTAGGEAGGGGESVGADHRGQRVLTPTHG